MIKSKYIQSILLLLAESHDDEEKIKKQVELLSESEFTYTGSGLFVSFSRDKSIDDYRIEIDEDIILGGVKITSSELEYGAQANLFFEDGVILYLEVVSNSTSYPEKGLDNYTLSQEWLPNGGRKITFPEPS